MSVVDATGDHVRDILLRPIRQADVDEWVLMSGCRPLRALIESLADSVDSGGSAVRAALGKNGETEALWGVEGLCEHGMAWLIATEGAGRWLHREWRGEIDRMHATYRTIGAVSYGFNTLHHHWLEVVGFVPIDFRLDPSGARYVVFARYKEESTVCASH